MFGQELILRTKLMPPRTRRWTLTRPRLYSRLDNAADYRLTLLEAPTGYGKTTTLAGWLAASERPYVWYSFGSLEADPLVVLVHLIYAFRNRFPTAGHQALELLQRERDHGEPVATFLAPAFHLLINDLCDLLTEETYLALDDFHLLDDRAESLALIEELIAAAPPRLHLLIASRSRPGFPGLARWRAAGEILLIDKNELAFRPAETEQLFREQYGLDLTPAQAALLTDETEGWVIALQMFWQSQSHSTPLTICNLPQSLPGLFDYLAQEVLQRQSAEVQQFLLGTSILRRLRGDLCAAVLLRSPAECEARLQTLSDAGLFLIPSTADLSYRYHHLFSEFLHTRLQSQDPARVIELHRRAARFYLQIARPEDAITHWLEAGDHHEARLLLETELADQLLSAGRLERLEELLKSFPAKLLETAPGLLMIQGDCYRLTSRFEPALTLYHQAANLFAQHNDRPGRTRALRGAALVYLDTVQPAQAEALLEETLALVNTGEDRPLQAALLRDLAENKINRGRPLEAEGLFRQARALLGQPENPSEDVRIFLRTGRLAEATEILERNLETDRAGGMARAGRNHRESLLVLSLIDSLRGDGSSAIARAEEGIKLAQALRTPFTEAVAWQRLGHAFTVANRPTEADEAYRRGFTLGDRLQVRRLRAEGFMGLCALEGRPGGDLAAARQAAEEGLQIARRAGDEWIEGFITLALAGALIQHGPLYSDEARTVLNTARQLLEACGDRFGTTLCACWLALLDPTLGHLEQFQAECNRAGYRFLLDRPTLFGPKDPTTLALLSKSSSPIPVTHTAQTPPPATPLAVLTLGSFVVRRPDGIELTNRDWQREKARQLFQLLLTLRDKPLPKEQILDLLWPESDFAAADAGFKVALNALTRALEPDRPSRAQSGYILKFGSGASLSYTLNLDPAAICLDAAEFEQLIRKGRQSEASNPQPASDELSIPPYSEGLNPSSLILHPSSFLLYSKAIALYRGDYLPACLYDDWAAPERERLLALFLTTAERLALAHATRAKWEQCLSLCHLILARDSCWEEAYRLTMLAYHRLGNRTAALRAYERCVAALSAELGLEPMPQTITLYQQILNY